MPRSAIRYTYEDYLQLPEDKRYEILEGELYMVPAPNILHQKVCLNLGAELLSFAKQSGLGQILVAPVDVLLGEEDVVQPDILFVSKSRLAIVKENYIKGAPDLVVEVLSAGTEKRDGTLKKKAYARAGVKELWLVDPEARTFETMINTGKGFHRKQVYAEGTHLTSEMLPGLKLEIGKVFA